MYPLYLLLLKAKINSDICAADSKTSNRTPPSLSNHRYQEATRPSCIHQEPWFSGPTSR